MNTLDPFSTPDSFRSWAYNNIVLKHESGIARILDKKYNKGVLKQNCNVLVERMDSLSLVDNFVKNSNLQSEEFMVFYCDKGMGYACLFKRLRDAFAHAHFHSPRNNWVEIGHSYKGRSDRLATRLFGRLKIASLKKLVAYIEVSN